MSAVDRNVLRVAAVELLEGDVPAAAAIDEAVEIALKHFSGAEAGRFVNGVLDAVRQELDGGAAGGGPGHSSSSGVIFGRRSVPPGDGAGGPAGAGAGGS